AGADAAAVLDHERDDTRVRVRRHGRQGGDALPEGAADLTPGGVRRVQDAPGTVRPFDGQRQLAVGIAVEGRAPLDQLAHVARAGDAAPDDEQVRVQLHVSSDPAILPSASPVEEDRRHTMTAPSAAPPTQRIPVTTPSGTYDVAIGAGSAAQLGALLDTLRAP